MPTIWVLRELFIYLLATGKIIRDSKTANLKVNVNVLRKLQWDVTGSWAVKKMAVTCGEYTLCCQVTLRTAELKKGLRQTYQKGRERKDIWRRFEGNFCIRKASRIK